METPPALSFALLSKTLSSNRLTLQPLNPSNDAALLYALFAPTPAIFKWMTADCPTSAEEYQFFLEAKARDRVLFTISEGGRLAGIVTLFNIDLEHRRVEIGMITVALPFQKKRIGLEASCMLVQHLIGLGVNRIEWRAHHDNKPSQACAGRIGFTWEVTMRYHMIVKGAPRHSWVSAITRDELPAVLKHQRDILGFRLLDSPA